MSQSKQYSGLGETISILEGVSANSIDTLYLVLLSCGERTHLPELYEIFGKGSLIKFLDIFSGTTIKVPPLKNIERAIRNVHITMRLRATSNSLAEIKALAAKYGITTSAVREAFASTCETLDKVRSTYESESRAEARPAD